MPFCVNCGTEVPMDCRKCLICGNDPFMLVGTPKEGKKAKVNAGSEERYMIPLLSLFVLFGAIFLLFGLSIWQMGVFSGGSSARYEAEYTEMHGVEPRGGIVDTIQGKEYHVYNVFDFGDFAFFVTIMGISMLLWSWYNLQKEIKSAKILMLAIIGIVLIILAFFIFVFGFNDLLTYTGGNVHDEPTFTQQYAWIIETVIFGAIGCALLFLAERFRKRENLGASVYPLIIAPLAYVLTVVVLLTYIGGLHNFLLTDDYTEYRTNLAWIVEIFVFGLSCVLLFILAERIKGGKLNLAKPLILSASILLIATLWAYIPGINTSFWNLRGNVDLGWVVEVLCFGIPALVLLRKADSIRRADNKKSIYPYILIPMSAILLVATTFAYVFGVLEALEGSSYYGKNFSWILEVVLFGVPAVTFLVVGDKIWRKEPGAGSALPFVLLPISYLFLFIAILFFVFGVHSALWDQAYHNFRWVVETIVFLVPSLACILYADRDRRFQPTFLLTAAAILLIPALFVYITGIHGVLNEYDSDSNDLIKVLIETFIFVVPAVTFLIIADGMRKKTGKARSILPYVLAPVAGIMLLAFLLIYMVGIHDIISGKYGTEELNWIAEVLLFLIPGAYLLWRADRIRVGEGATGSILGYPLYALSVIFIIATLFVFVLGLNDFLRSRGDERNLNWFVETILYLVSASVPFYLAEKFQRDRN